MDSDSDNDDILYIDSDIDTDSDNEFGDDDFDHDSDLIYRQDEEHLDSEKLHNSYYIGLCNIYSFRKTMLFVNSISTRTYYKHSHENILKYLKNYSIFRTSRHIIEIMQLKILQNGTYSVIIKTHWLKMVQRHWKKTYKHRMSIIKQRHTPSSIFMVQQTGRYPAGLNVIPTIHGMLRQYSK